MRELSDRSVLVIDTLIHGLVAWHSPAALARRLGWTLDEISDILCDLDIEGLIAIRDTDRGILVSLSQDAASRSNASVERENSARNPRSRGTPRPEPFASRSSRTPTADTEHVHRDSRNSSPNDRSYRRPERRYRDRADFQ